MAWVELEPTDLRWLEGAYPEPAVRASRVVSARKAVLGQCQIDLKVGNSVAALAVSQASSLAAVHLTFAWDGSFCFPRNCSGCFGT